MLAQVEIVELGPYWSFEDVTHFGRFGHSPRGRQASRNDKRESEDFAPPIEPADGEPTTELPPGAESQRVKMPIRAPGAPGKPNSKRNPSTRKPN